MSRHIAVETSGRCEMICTADQSEIRQSLESPVNGRAREARDSLLHLNKNLFDSRMIIALEQGRVNYPPLDGDGHSLAPARSRESHIIRVLFLG